MLVARLMPYPHRKNQEYLDPSKARLLRSMYILDDVNMLSFFRSNLIELLT